MVGQVFETKHGSEHWILSLPDAISQRLSIQGKTYVFYSSYHCLTIFEMYFGSLSCWKLYFNGTFICICFSRIFLYIYLSIIPSIRAVVQFHMQLQNIYYILSRLKKILNYILVGYELICVYIKINNFKIFPEWSILPMHTNTQYLEEHNVTIYIIYHITTAKKCMIFFLLALRSCKNSFR